LSVAPTQATSIVAHPIVHALSHSGIPPALWTIDLLYSWKIWQGA